MTYDSRVKEIAELKKRVRVLEKELRKLARRVLEYVHEPDPENADFLDCDIEVRAMANAALKIAKRKS